MPEVVALDLREAHETSEILQKTPISEEVLENIKEVDEIMREVLSEIHH